MKKNSQPLLNVLNRFCQKRGVSQKETIDRALKDVFVLLGCEQPTEKNLAEEKNNKVASNLVAINNPFVVNVKKVENIFVYGGEQPCAELIMAHKGKGKYKAGRKDTAQLDDVENLLK